MTAPINVIAQTHNLWGDHYPAERAEALRGLYERRAPDLLGTQETRPWSRDVLDAAMPDHDRVHDDFPGWERQSNLWWNGELFSEVEHGADHLGPGAEIRDVELGRLARQRRPRAAGGGGGEAACA